MGWIGVSRTRSEQWRAVTPQSRALSSVQSFIPRPRSPRQPGVGVGVGVGFSVRSGVREAEEGERGRERESYQEQSGNRACARARPQSGRRTWDLVLPARRHCAVGTDTDTQTHRHWHLQRRHSNIQTPRRHPKCLDRSFDTATGPASGHTRTRAVRLGR
jgi:hypothetical protein